MAISRSSDRFQKKPTILNGINIPSPTPRPVNPILDQYSANVTPGQQLPVPQSIAAGQPDIDLQRIYEEILRPRQAPESPTTLGSVPEAFQKKGFGGGLAQILKYAASPEGQKIVSGLVGDPYLGGALVSQATEQEQRQRAEQASFQKSEKERMGRMLDIFMGERRQAQSERQFERKLEQDMEQEARKFGLDERKLKEDKRQFDLEYDLKEKELMSELEGGTGNPKFDNLKDNTKEEFANLKSIKDRIKEFEKLSEQYGKEVLATGTELGPIGGRRQKVKGIQTKISIFTGGHPKESVAIKFEAMRSSLYSVIARRIAAEKGPLSKEDQKLIEDAIPNLTDTIQGRNDKFKNLNEANNINLKNKMLVHGLSNNDLPWPKDIKEISKPKPKPKTEMKKGNGLVTFTDKGTGQNFSIRTNE